MRTLILYLSFLFPIALHAQFDISLIDGILSQPSAESTELETPPDIEMRINREGNLMYLSIRSETLFVASLCISNEEKVQIYHASAALGNIIYRKEESGEWITTENFNWDMRDSDMSEETIRKRVNYFASNNWVANTTSMGNPGETEFLISLDEFGESPVFLAAGLMPESNPEAIIPLPTQYAGDCADYKLVAGPPRNRYKFEPANWFQVR